MPTRCNRGFYCRSYCLLNMFRAPLCLSSGAQEYYAVVAACGISCCGFQVAGLVWSRGLCVRFAGCCATCPAHLILLDFTTRSSLCNFLHSPVTSYFLGPNILLNTLFSNTLSLRSSLNVSDQVSHPYSTTGNML